MRILLLFLGLSSLGLSGDKKSPYSIISDEKMGTVKRSVDVRLADRVSKEELTKIAGEIKAMNSTKFERTFILYYLPEQEVGAGAWASSHYNPNLKVEILGTIGGGGDAGKAKPPKDATEVVGRWDYRSFPGIVFTLFRVKDGFMLQFDFKNAGSLEERVTAKREEKRIIIRPVDPENQDYWILDEEKNLLLMDSTGLLGKAVAIKEDVSKEPGK